MHQVTRGKPREFLKQIIAGVMAFLLAITCIPLVPSQPAYAETVTTNGHGPYYTKYTVSVQSGDETVYIDYNPGGGNVIADRQVKYTYTASTDPNVYDGKNGNVVSSVPSNWVSWEFPTVTFSPGENDRARVGNNYSYTTITPPVDIYNPGSGEFTGTWVDASSTTLKLASTYETESYTLTSSSLSPVANPLTVPVFVVGAPRYEETFTNFIDHGTFDVWIKGSVPPYHDYKNPIVTDNPSLIKKIGDPISSEGVWSEGIKATWGYTTTNTIPSLGKITDVSLVYGTDAALATTGTSFDRIGVKEHAYVNQDTHGVNGDGTYATTKRKIIVQAAAAPSLVGKFAPGAVDENGTSIAGQSYSSGKWTNQNVVATLSSTDSGSYDMVLKRGGTTVQQTSVSAPPLPSPLSTTYSTQTTSLGVDFTGALVDTTDNTIALSPVSTLNVKIDKTKPTPGALYSGGTFSDTSTDGLSGIASSKSKIALTSVGGAAPANSDYESFGSLSVSSPGYYDVWVWAWDKAGNSAQAKALSNILILSSQAPTIKGTLVSDGSAHLSGEWTNEDVKVTATPPSISGSYFTALYEGLTQVAKSTSAPASTEKVYSAETSGTNVIARLVDSSDLSLSVDSTTYVVKIDKTNPTGAVSLNSGTFDFTDDSTDTVGVANSGVDGTKTKVAIVSTGSAQPGSSSYEAIAGATLPSSGYYDVWVIATDNAGNESSPAMSLQNVSRSGLDYIEADDFMYGISQGLISDADAIAHAAAGKYYGGTDIPAGSLIVDAMQLADINAAITAGDKSGNPFPLTFKTPAGGHQATVTIDVTLFDNGTGGAGAERIYGDDFMHGISQGLLSDADALAYANASALDAGNNSIPQGSLLVDPTELADINAAITAGDKSGNPFPLTFEAPGGTRTTVNVTLYDHGTGIVGQERIYANDFFYGIDEGLMADATALLRANSLAFDASNNPIPQASLLVDPTELADINAAIAAGDKSGNPFPLTFEAPGGTRTTVNVTLYDHVIDAGGDRIGANDFIYGIDEGSMDDLIAKVRGAVIAENVNGVPYGYNDIDVDQSTLDAINDAIASGMLDIYPLTFVAPDGTSTTVGVTLKGHGVSPSAGTGNIGASDFIYGLDEGTPLNDATAIDRAQALAKDVMGTEFPSTSLTVDGAELAAINAATAPGNFPLTFTSPEGKSVTVTVTVTDASNPIVVLGETSIGANDFRHGIDKGEMSADDTLQFARAIGFNGNGSKYPTSMLTVDGTGLAAINAAIKAGDKSGNPFSLTFGEPGGKTVTIKVTLYDHTEHHVDRAINSMEMGANDFTHSVKNGTLSDNDARQMSSVYAKDQLGIDIPADQISVNQDHFALINEVIGREENGVFDLEFTTADGQSITIKVTLIDGKIAYDGGNDSTQKSPTQKSPTYKGAFPKTGDNALFVIAGVLALAALLTLICVIARRKKSENRK